MQREVIFKNPVGYKNHEFYVKKLGGGPRQTLQKSGESQGSKNSLGNNPTSPKMTTLQGVERPIYPSGKYELLMPTLDPTATSRRCTAACQFHYVERVGGALDGHLPPRYPPGRKKVSGAMGLCVALCVWLCGREVGIISCLIHAGSNAGLLVSSQPVALSEAPRTRRIASCGIWADVPPGPS